MPAREDCNHIVGVYIDGRTYRVTLIVKDASCITSRLVKGMPEKDNWRGTIFKYCPMCGTQVWFEVEKYDKELGNYKTMEYRG